MFPSPVPSFFCFGQTFARALPSSLQVIATLFDSAQGEHNTDLSASASKLTRPKMSGKKYGGEGGEMGIVWRGDNSSPLRRAFTEGELVIEGSSKLRTEN